MHPSFTNALEEMREAMYRRDSEGVMAALEPFYDSPMTLCALSGLLAGSVAQVVKQAGGSAPHRFELEGLSDHAAETIAALVVARGNGDRDGACDLMHTISDEETVSVIAGLVHMVATIAEPNS
jgi:hypothetical protein